MTDVVLVPPNTLPRIERIWAYVSVDESGSEGVCSAPLLGPGSLVPLIAADAADEARLVSLTPIAEQLARWTGRKIVLAEFATRRDVRVITGATDG